MQDLCIQLVKNHGIDHTLFADGFITTGADKGWEDAIDRHAEAKKKQARDNSELRPNEVAQAERDLNRMASRTLKETPFINWNLYSAVITDRGIIKPGLEWAGHRLHPSIRTGDDDEIKFDCRSSRVKVFLPPLSWSGAMELLDHYGFDCPDDQYSIEKAWQFVFDNPEVPVHVEESALKALASSSIGQLAVALNGINSGGQKLRSDRLRKPLEMLAAGGRRITVRFDAGNSSVRMAQQLHRQLSKAGADARWYCWIGSYAKTDDYVAAKLRGMQVPASLPILGHQEDLGVRGFFSQAPYSRLRKQWSTITIDREFEPEDIQKASIDSRVIALVGATGTAKTKASVAAVDLMERELGHRMVVLGLYHRASLVHKGAAEFGVRDMSAARNTVERTLGVHEGVFNRDGLFCCCESIQKPPGNEWDMWRWSHELEENPRPTFLFMDETSQTGMHLLVGGTERMPEVRREAVRALERLLKNPCVTVIAAESGLGDIELEWLKETTGTTPRVIQTTFARERVLYVGETNRENIDLLQQLSAQALEDGHKVWASFGEAKSMIEFSAVFTDEKNVLQISAENSSSQAVSEFMGNTEGSGPAYDMVAMSPSVISGISMAKTSVGIAACVQQYAMGPEDALQALDRARSAQVRVLLMPSVVPNAMVGTRKTTFEAVQRAKSKAASHGDLDAYRDFAGAISTGSLFYSHELEARNNYEAFANEHVLKCRLQEQGYTLKPFLELLAQNPNKGATTSRKVRAKRQRDNAKSFRQGLLRQLCKREIRLGEARSQAQKASVTGLAVDYERRDPSHAFYWLERLSVISLIDAGMFHEGTQEFAAVASLVQNLVKKEAQELKQLLGGKIVIPGPDDVVKATFIKALVQMAGFDVARGKQVSTNGIRVWSYTVS
ncbi:hypothetical protein SynBIOSE41_01977 [Synechococcus sp. BIOS-E4-1]|uniref:DUF3854 domain-containing protein n=1 Tax=Synechococcus sp. BIOS-E4-1 TaxID=1400864 RepID=UPI0016447ACD|nr:DUF3854 domain-containing protein [Synechococcus sp. BIOS-E4-1]QNI54483.1 hypothetical protein SynBIOSE41_01977 [Synechococcus sp. BIOS-E4-1]